MAIINLRRYYPHYSKDKFIDVSDEVAAALDEGKRIERRQDKKRTYYTKCALIHRSGVVRPAGGCCALRARWRLPSPNPCPILPKGGQFL